MEQMEVTPVPLDGDNNGNINIVISNSETTNQVNYIFNPSVNAMQSENDNSDLSVNEEDAPEAKTDNSTIPCQSEKLPEIFENIHLINDMPSVETDKGNSDLHAENVTDGNETIINKYDGSCLTDVHPIDEACHNKSVTSHATGHLTESSRENIQGIACNSNSYSGHLAANVLDNCTTAKDFSNNAQTFVDGVTKEICEEQTVQSCKSETECDLNKTSTARKESELVSKPFQIDCLQKQTSEIKELVMGFLTKYTNTDEASCSGHPPVPAVSIQDCGKIKQSQVIKERNKATEIVWIEECDTLNPIKTSNDAIQNPMEATLASPQNPKFHSDSVLKSSDTEGFSSVCSSPNEIISQLKDPTSQQKICTTFVSQVPSQSSFIFNVSNNEPLSSTMVSTSCKSKCNSKITNDVMGCFEPETAPEPIVDICTTRPNTEFTLNNFELETTQKCQPLNSKSDVWNIPASTSENNAKGIRQQNELNPSSMPFECLSPCSKDVFGLKMQFSSSQKNETCPFLNTTCINRVTCTLQSTNTDPVNSWLSWGRMSGELHTTPSINAPILSSKSSNDSSSPKYIPFTNNSFVSNVLPDNTELPQLSTKSGSKSRRTKSSDAMFYNFPKPFSIGATAFSNNANSKYQKCDNSCLVKAENMDGINLPHSSIAQDGNGLFSSQNNINRHSQALYVNSFRNLTFRTSGVPFVPLPSEFRYFERPFENNLTKGNVENPFSKKSPIESIGLFKSPMKSVVNEVGNSAFKHVPSLLFPIKKEKEEEFTGIEEASGMLKPVASNDPLVFPLRIKNKQNQGTHTATEFTMSNLCTNESPKNKQVLNCDRTSSENISEQPPFDNSVRVPSQLNSNSLFQFTFTAEKSRTHCTSRMTLPRVKKAVRRESFFDRVSWRDIKGNNTSNVCEKGPEDTPFKPVYGSDVKFETGTYKNVFVRYQNIVFMDDYAHVSPEELRSQFYTKAAISGPFKFGASMESHENHYFKKTQNQEIQTDEDLASKNPDLTAIWRVLECPVCLDVVLPPVYQCEQGHHACSTCWTKVLTCPLCKRPQSCTRNYMAEALVEQVPLPCRYHIEGCKETVQHNSKVSHEENCSFRMYQCPVPMCNQALSYQNMCKHFKKHHKNILHHEGHSVGKGEKFCDVLYKEALLSSLVHAFDITKWGLFFLREVTVGRSTAFFVQVMPAASDQAVYFYHLEVCDHHDCRKECFKGRVFPMCKPSQEIIDQEEYLCLSELILKTVKKTTPLKIVVTIWQLKPAFTLSS